MNQRTFQNRPLTNDELRAIAPSAFAVQPYHGMSSRYEFVPTINVVDGLAKAGFVPYSAQQSTTRVESKQDYTRHLIRFRSQHANLTALGDSTVEAVLLNSHDGSSVYELSLGIWRLACLNGMMVSDSPLFESIRVRHIGNGVVDAVIESMTRLLQQAPKVLDTINLWKQIELTRPEALVFAETAASLRFTDAETAPSAEQLLQPRRSADTGKDLYTTYNVLQEQIIRGGVTPRRDGRRVYSSEGRRVGRTREVKGIPQQTTLNRALFSLASKMCELKTAA